MSISSIRTINAPRAKFTTPVLGPLGVVSTPSLLSDVLTIFNKMAISKLLSDAFGEKRAWGEGG
jgi:hypothetical protein